MCLNFYLIKDQVDVLVRSLQSLVADIPLLDDCLVSGQGMSGERVSGGSGPGSRPPCRLDVVDVRAEVDRVVSHYAGRLAFASGVVLPQTRTSDVLSRWLLSEVGGVGFMEWAAECVDDLQALAARVHDVVAPDDGAGLEAAPAGEWDTSHIQQPVLVGVREASRMCKRLGVAVAHQSVSRWAASGRITSHEVGIDDYRVDFREVLSVAQSMMRASA